MTCTVTLPKNVFSESLAIVGRAVGHNPTLTVLSHILLRGEASQLRLSATDLTLGVTVWLDANLDGELSLTLPARTLTDVVNTLSEPEVSFKANGRPEVSLQCGAFKGTVKGLDASEFPEIPNYDLANGILLDAARFREMIQRVAFAASLDDSRPVLTGVLVTIADKSLSMVATDGYRLAIQKMNLSTPAGNRWLIFPANALREVARILVSTKASSLTLYLPNNGNQVVLRCDNVQIVCQLIDGKFPDYQMILPKSHKTRTLISTTELLKACKQANIIARESSHVVRFHLLPKLEQAVELGGGARAKVILQAEADTAGASQIELPAIVEGPELEIAFNIKFLLEGLEAVATDQVVIETNTHNSPAVLRPANDTDWMCVLMPMHIEVK